MSVLPETAAQRRAAQTAWPAIREVIVVGSLFLAYKLARLAVNGHAAKAMSDAWDVWGLERRIDLPSEAWVQHLILHSRAVVYAANSYYAYVHFTATAAALVWMYLRRPAHYRWFRRMLAFLTGAALLVHVMFPVAPPRMLTSVGMVDTGRVFGPSVYGSPSTDALTNQYAAMPSLHVGWALAVAIALISVTRGRWRWAWLLYPVLTLTVVVCTANHYWLDAAAGVALVGVVLLCLPFPARQLTGQRSWWDSAAIPDSDVRVLAATEDERQRGAAG